MYSLNPYYPIQQQWNPWLLNQSYIASSLLSPEQYSYAQYSAEHVNVRKQYQSPTVTRDPRTYTDSDLTNLLDKNTSFLKRMHENDEQKRLPVLLQVLTILKRVPRRILILKLQNEFFSLLQHRLVHLLTQWIDQSKLLSNDEIYIFRIIIKLIRKSMKVLDDIEVIPSWLFDSSLLTTIAHSLTFIANSPTIINQNNKHIFKYFIRLFDTYLLYQQRFASQHQSHKDSLNQLLQPIQQCLSSSHFIQIFTSSTSLTSIEKFFLRKCPAFILSYNGSQLQQTMENLLENILPKYDQLLTSLLSNIKSWKKVTIENVDYLLQLLNHGANHLPTNAKLVSNHLSLIDNVLKIVDEPMLYNHLHENLSNIETSLMNSCVSFLVNMISDPTILAHIKQRQVANVFLRLTTCKYEPLVFNIYALLAYTTHEEDIKKMDNPGRLLATIIKSLKVTLKKMPNNHSHKEQLLETLKGLIQHDQIKDEVIKQNALPFLLECTDKLTDQRRILILEILWTLTFHEKSLSALRANSQFLEKIKNISKDEKNEPLKKAADGLVWKLVQEPASLQKVAQQEEDEKVAKESVETIIEEIVNNQGQKQLVATVKPTLQTDEERTFKYDMMISYCHSDKDLTYKIHKFLLDQGFKVWIDLDNMYGPTMNAMAEAVENSEFVIMCMSDAYKQSTYCQAEAEYAFNCKRRLLPLIMRRGYRPDGWLGFLVGSRLYIDFGRFDFEIGCDKLLTEISLQRKQPLVAKPSHTNHLAVSPIPTNMTTNIPKKEKTENYRPFKEKPVSPQVSSVLSKYLVRQSTLNFNRKPMIAWTDSDVLDFLYTHRLIQMMPVCDSMDGRALIQLYKMCLSGSSNLYTVLNEELKSNYKLKLSIGVYTRFLGIIEHRLSMPTPIPQQFERIHPQRTQAPLISAMYDRMRDYTLPSATVPVSAPVPTPPKIHHVPSITNTTASQHLPYSNQPYDLVITSNASPLELLRAIEQYGPNPKKLSSLQTPQMYSFKQ